MSFKRCSALSAAAWLLAAATVSAAPPSARGKEAFPPLPEAAELAARNDAERQAGAVILEDVTEVAGHVEPDGQDPWTRKQRRVRYLVLDAKGAAQLAQHAYFGLETEAVLEIRGRTLTPGGQVFPLDPDRDVRNLDVKVPRGKIAATVRTVFFPHVEPGAVLDLAWTVTSKDLPTFLVVPLQEAYPIRRLQVKSQGLLLKSNLGSAFLGSAPTASFFWVPFFAGPVPARARARLDEALNLDLEVEDLPAAAASEPYAPPDVRTGHYLGLLPRALGLTEKRSARDWHENLILFGPPGAVPENVQKEVVDRELAPEQGLVRLNDLALQDPPKWPAQEALLADHQKILRDIDGHFDRKFRRSRRGEDEKDLAQIAPPSLDWRERARRLYDHARRRVRVDAGANAGWSLEDILKQGRGASEDLTFYYRLLLERAGIPSRLVLALNRRLTPYQPYLNLAVFGARFLVEAGPPGEASYFYLGDRFADSSTVPDGFLGGLGFRQPDKVGGDWPFFQIPPELPVLETTRLTFSSRLQPDGKAGDLSLETALEGNAAWAFRFHLAFRSGAGVEASERQRRRQEVIRSWVDEWANVPIPGEPPVLDPEKQSEGPFSFALTVPWQPDVQPAGNRLLIPALPRADLFQNVFLEETRQSPLWLPGGNYEVALSWELPAGAGLAAAPAPARGEGPGGLSWSLEVVPQPSAGAGPARVTSRLLLTLPRFLPAADYAAARRFFEGLQRAAETRLLVRMEG